MPKIKHCKNEFYCHIEENDGNAETIHLAQNTEVKGHDHWLVEFSLNRWRKKKDLVAYLKQIIDVVESA